MKKIIALAFSCVLIAFTNNADTIKPTFYLRNKGAQMPVVIRGNIHSGVLIIFLHGGPGGTSLKKIGTRAFNALEESVGIVYWEQRGAHGARGGTRKERMNLDQFVEDLDLLVDQLQSRYAWNKIFLMGHCWGGGLGAAYLIDSARQSKIAGWITVAGAYNNPGGDHLSAEWVKAQAQKKIEAGEEKSYWTKALRWYEKNPTFTSNQLGHYSFVRKLSGYQFAQGDSLGIFPGYSPSDILKNPVQYASYYINYYRTLNKFIISAIDLTPEMRNITIPSLILWGAEDGLIPVQQAYELHRTLGTAHDRKRIIVFEQTAHTIYYEQPTRFVKEVVSFVNEHICSSPLIAFSDSDKIPN